FGLPLVVTFQAPTAPAALGLAIATGLTPEAAIEALPRLKGVPGRMERVARTPAGGQVFVDYAHTPGALETVLQAIAPHTEARLWVVFGCGGDRDRGKRPIMGEIACRLADRVIVTDDNPRGEDPAAIRREILAAAPQAEEFSDRGEAIASAMAALGPGDVLVIAGKGHESGQIVGDRVLPFNDRDVARAAVTRLADAGDPGADGKGGGR
ncbi:MAG: UDP-N-acetylmuramoyl-L-alanyl-D-glutamate--2,6-diaminopimelate ligase, partial [Proteobacteria bacterium]|nr:UDP-N-acetylmuramoyl-L-alanyl-D-glutamate--2,6-diaminopimelate ligase [Pseudomonadota bacterium]